MFRGLKRLGLLALTSLLLTSPILAGENYRGFTIDESAVRQASNRDALLAATREQIDIVHAVGLPAEILSFVQGVKFELVPDGTFKSPTPGRYMGRGDQSVQVSAAIVRTGHKPVLLHELMHAYHDRRIEHGFKNRVILGFYKNAQALPAFAPKSHMMANEKEYFACTATVYLFGVTAQEPFTRKKLQQQQPAAYEYLEKLFGPAAGRHQGSLTKSPLAGRDVD